MFGAVSATATPVPTATPRPTSASASTIVYPTLSMGSSGSAVAQLQRALISLGYLSGNADGIYGSATAAAVRSFQQKKGIDADGVIRADTWAALLGVKT